jgi:hypothetical protein
MTCKNITSITDLIRYLYDPSRMYHYQLLWKFIKNKTEFLSSLRTYATDLTQQNRLSKQSFMD